MPIYHLFSSQMYRLTHIRLVSECSNWPFRIWCVWPKWVATPPLQLHQSISYTSILRIVKMGNFSKVVQNFQQHNFLKTIFWSFHLVLDLNIMICYQWFSLEIKTLKSVSDVPSNSGPWATSSAPPITTIKNAYLLTIRTEAKRQTHVNSSEN